MRKHTAACVRAQFFCRALLHDCAVCKNRNSYRPRDWIIRLSSSDYLLLRLYIHLRLSISFALQQSHQGTRTDCSCLPPSPSTFRSRRRLATATTRPPLSLCNRVIKGTARTVHVCLFLRLRLLRLRLLAAATTRALFRFSTEPSRDRNEQLLFMIDHQATSFAFQQSHSGTGTNCS